MQKAVDRVIGGDVWDKVEHALHELGLGIQTVNVAQPDLGLLIATT